MKQLASLNRNIYSQGADEMINLEQDLNGSLKVIKDKKLLFTIDVDSNTKGVFKHNTVDADTYIIRYTSSDIEVYNMSGDTLQYWQIPSEWGNIVDVKPYENSIVVSCENSYVLYYRKDGEYTLLEYDNIPDIDFNLSGVINTNLKWQIWEEIDGSSWYSAIPENLATQFRNDYDTILTDSAIGNYLKEGYFGLVLSYRDNQNENVLTTAPFLVNCGARKAEIQLSYGRNNDFYYRIDALNSCIAEIKLKFNNIFSEDIAETIKYIDIYTTRHLPLFDFNYEMFETIVLGQPAEDQHLQADITEHLIYDINEHFPNELFYLYDSIEYSKTNIDEDYIFTQEKFEDVVSNKTLAVNNDAVINSNGNMFIYNKRVHYYNTKKQLKQISNASITNIKTDDNPIINLTIDDKKIFAGHSNFNVVGPNIQTMNAFISTPIVCDAIEIIRNDVLVYGIKLDEYLTYNYSYAFVSDIKDSFKYYYPAPINNTYNPIESETVNILNSLRIPSLDPTLDSDKSTLIVSTNTNPLIFDIEKVYDFDGAILNIDVATEQVSQSQIGMYPIYVFTDDGIVLLEQGSGDVLYSRQTKISNDIAVSVQQVDKAVAYITDGADLKLISGSQTFDISKNVLDFYLDNSIRNSIGISQTTKNNALTQIGQFISDREFKDFVLDANMAYDTLERNLILSSNREYSYVYNMINRMWSKVDRHYSFSSFGIAGFDTQDDTTEIYDLTKDVDTNKDVLYLSMPLSFENYNTIKQIGFYGNFSIPSDKVFGLYIFASNDKANWELVNSRQFATVTPQVILPRIGRAYKYIRILLCGEVLTDFSIMGFKLNTVEKYNKRLR